MTNWRKATREEIAAWLDHGPPAGATYRLHYGRGLEVKVPDNEAADPYSWGDEAVARTIAEGIGCADVNEVRSCPCRPENGGSGVCGCILGGPRVTC